MIAFDKRTSGRFSPGFTLTELLTVIAIIALLIGIVIPTTSAVRRKAKEARTRVKIQAISTACEGFRADQNEYPQSNPAWYGSGDATAQRNWEVSAQGSIQQPLWGANLIVDCLIGRDGLGFDPKAGTGPGNTSLSRYSQSQTPPPPRSRKPTYLASDSVQLSDLQDHKPRDKFGEYQGSKVMPVADANDTPQGVPIFLDDFGQPILYYRANPVARPQTPIMQLSNEVNSTQKGSGVYDGRDNGTFTDHTGPGPNDKHKIDQATTGITSGGGGGIGGDPANNNNFAVFIRSNHSSTRGPNGVVTKARPVKADSFILLSPGSDGVWGTGDDLANFDLDSR